MFQIDCSQTLAVGLEGQKYVPSLVYTCNYSYTVGTDPPKQLMTMGIVTNGSGWSDLWSGRVSCLQPNVTDATFGNLPAIPRPVAELRSSCLILKATSVRASTPRPIVG